MTPDTPPRRETADGRRAYARPRLAVYGDLRSLTRSNITQFMNDRGSASNTMT